MKHFWLTVRYWLCQLFLKPFIKPKHLPPSTWENLATQIDYNGTCFIIEGYQAADKIAIERTLRATNNSNHDCQFIFLPKSLNQLLENKAPLALIKAQESRNLMLASVFWGRQANKSNGFLATYFSQSFAPITIFRRAIIVLFQARQVSCYISSFELSRPDSILTLDDLHKARKQLHTQRELVTGPDLSHQRTFITKVIRSPEVQTCITALIQNEGLSETKATKKAEKIYREIAADYSYSTLRFLETLLSFVWQKLYNGIDIHNFDEVNKIAQTHQVIYTPCHRSHIDYLLLSYAIYHQGLMPPHIAAGINLNLPIIGTILRKGGAFFIRRQFRGQKLYRAVLENYINCMIEAGIPLEYFAEGGRSRTGLLLPTRPGMLAMTVRAAIKPKSEGSTQKPIAIIPVYIGYEKLIESHSYINELYGSKKEKESIRSLFAARKHLFFNYGKVYVNFANPIYLNALCQTASPMLSDNELTNYCVTQLCHKIPTAINHAAIITPANLAATALLASNRNALLEHQLHQQCKILQGICAINQSLDITKTLSSHDIVQHCENSELIHTEKKTWGKIYLLDQKGEINATFLRNNTLHNFITPAIIATILLKHPNLHKQKIINTCRRLLPFIQSELYVDENREALPNKVQQYLDFFEQQALITQDNSHYTSSNNESESYYQLSLIAGSSKAALERFYITSQCLLNAPTGFYSRVSLEKSCIDLAQQLSLLHSFHAPDFFDKNLFRTFIDQLITQTVIIENEQGNLIGKRRLLLSAELASQVLSTNALRNIKQLAHKLNKSHK